MKTLKNQMCVVLMTLVGAMAFVACQGDSGKNKNVVNESDAVQEGVSKEEVQVELPNIINCHEYVDLGLSVKWATCNVGATSPEDCGDYFAWGETSTKSSYAKENSKTFGKSMGSIAGNPQCDAARANWGGTWRLPTEDEIEELMNKCNWTWVTQGGHDGYKVAGPNGNSIYLPAAGWYYGTSLLNAGEDGYYWSATPDAQGTSYGACGLDFRGGDFSKINMSRDILRNGGRSVRPVSD